MYITISDSDANFEIVLHITVVVIAQGGRHNSILPCHPTILHSLSRHRKKLDNNTFSHK